MSEVSALSLSSRVFSFFLVDRCDLPPLASHPPRLPCFQDETEPEPLLAVSPFWPRHPLSLARQATLSHFSAFPPLFPPIIILKSFS